MDLKEIGVYKMNRVDLVKDRDCGRVLVNATLNLRVP